MFIRKSLWLSGLFVAAASCADSSSDTSSSSSSSSASSETSSSATNLLAGSFSTISVTSTEAFTGSQYTYLTYDGQSTVTATGHRNIKVSTSGSSTTTLTGTKTKTGSSTSTTSKGTTQTVTLLVGGGGVQTEKIINGTVTIMPSSNSTVSPSSGTGTSTSSSATATNTTPCNGWAEFCSRQYSNITQVCAHNSAFSITGNAASNQALTVTQQLNDGIRMIQGETHYVNDTIYNCHTSCDLLNAGTWQSELETIATWVRAHPYDIVTILIVNSDFINVNNYTAPLQDSGLAPYLYTPPYIPMRLDDWPTLSEMILNQQRVVVFMDYNANQTAVPYILDEFSHMWETPFSPTNNSFPCTVQRPPTLKNMTRAKDEFMYLANHNLNVEIAAFGESILIPNTADLNTTNAAGDQLGMLGATAGNCTGESLTP